MKLRDLQRELDRRICIKSFDVNDNITSLLFR